MPAVCLLDVNVLIALLWPAHESHDVVHRWFSRAVKRGWATCPFTQSGFVRIVSNPAFSVDAVTPEEALNVLHANTRHRAHHFWSDDISFIDAVQPLRPRLVGHRQITDAYLLGLAMHRKGRLATLDQHIGTLLPRGDAGENLEIIGE